MDYAKKIMYQSNYWYNDGLKKAQERDMNGAIIALRQSIIIPGRILQREIFWDWYIME